MPLVQLTSRWAQAHWRVDSWDFAGPNLPPIVTAGLQHANLAGDDRPHDQRSNEPDHGSDPEPNRRH